MPHPIDVYWSFRSPYSFLATQRLRTIQAERDVVFNVKIVLPLAIRDPGFFDGRGSGWLGYVMRDVMRLAEMSGQMIRPPNPDPIVQDMATATIAPEQPYIWDISRLGLIAAQSEHGLAFLDHVSQLIWSGEDWTDDNRLSQAVTTSGLDLTALRTSISGNEDALDHQLAENDKALRRAGHWGVPTCVLNGEPFFGGDRLDMVLWRLDQMGIA